MTLAEMVYEYRTSHKYSLRDFGKLCGLSYAQISLLEKGVNAKGKPFIPSIETLDKLSKGMGIPVDTLLRAVKGQPVSLTGEDMNCDDISPERQAVMDQIPNLTDDEFDALVQFLKLAQSMNRK